MKIDNAVVVITAGGSSSGRAMAEHFCSLGADVALLDTEWPALRLSADQCRPYAGRVQPICLADDQPASVHEAFAQVTQLFGGIDVLINQWQGDILPSLFDNGAWCDTPRTLTDTTSQCYLVVQHAAECMQQRGRPGVIINVAGAHLTPDTVASAMIGGLTQRWAKELSGLKIRVGGIVPRHRRRATGELDDDLIRNAEYIVSNDSFNGRLLEASG
jgi:Dehydrogenases with different specificities (related to short-chain alcohol dehydrogenases)